MGLLVFSCRLTPAKLTTFYAVYVYVLTLFHTVTLMVDSRNSSIRQLINFWDDRLYRKSSIEFQHFIGIVF
jgi:hypothetical protein